MPGPRGRKDRSGRRDRRGPGGLRRLFWVAAIVLVVVVVAVAAGCGGLPSSSGATPSEDGAGTQAARPSPSPSPVDDDAGSPSPAAAPELVFSDPEFAFELRRTMAAIYAGEADLGECLATARRIKDGDFESWYAEWYATAQDMRAMGDRALAAGHEVTAREAYYRAATYYRTAEFFLHGDPSDHRIVRTWRKGRDAFVAAAGLDTIPFERVRIPYQDTTLPGYFYRPTAPTAPRPLLILQTGFDGCQEELHPYALAALRRGYNVLTFEGPGQGQVIRIQHIGFRADWEVVVRQVVDYAVDRPDVDPERIALWGISLGGYLAPRAAGYEHRLAAVIADGAIYDVAASLLAGLKANKVVPDSMTEAQLRDYLGGDPKEFNEGIRAAMAQSTAVRWQNEHGMFVFRAKSPALFWAQYAAFSQKESAPKVRCPTLVCYAEADSFDPQGVQAKRVYRHLTCPKTLMRFSQRYEAGYHCQLGAFAVSWGRKFDWLDRTLSVQTD